MPRKWAQQFNIKKGDELEIEEQGNKLMISTQKGSESKSIEINVTGLDRTTILYYIQSIYRAGYDEIKVIFKEPTTLHFRHDKKVNVISVLHTEINRLIGYEIIQQREDFCLIKDLSTTTIKEFDTVLRRIFLLLNDASADLFKGAKEGNYPLIETIEEKHDSITKFISYCTRLLNKYGYPDSRKTPVLYHILLVLDKIIDVLKNAGRDILKFKEKLHVKTLQLIELVNKCIHLYSEYFYKFDLTHATEMYKGRNDMLNALFENRSKMPAHELVLATKLEHALELLTDIEVARMSVEFQ